MPLYPHIAILIYTYCVILLFNFFYGNILLYAACGRLFIVARRCSHEPLMSQRPLVHSTRDAGKCRRGRAVRPACNHADVGRRRRPAGGAGPRRRRRSSSLHPRGRWQTRTTTADRRQGRGGAVRPACIHVDVGRLGRRQPAGGGAAAAAPFVQPASTRTWED